MAQAEDGRGRMKSVIVKFREYMKEASSTEKGVIRYLLEHPEQVAEMNIRELANVSYASSSTITRLCRKTGFQHYKDFQKSLMYENALRKNTITDKNCEIDKGDSLEEVVDKVIYKSIVSLEDTKSLIDLNTLDKSVDLLAESRKIVFFGMGASLLVARDAYLKFLRVNKPCLVNEDYHTQIVTAENMNSADAAVIISYSGMTKEMVRCAEIMKNSNVPFIAITCFRESPISKMADYNLYITATEFEFRTGKLASRISQLCVVDMLYAAYMQRNYEECMRSLKRTFIPKNGALPGEGEL